MIVGAGGWWGGGGGELAPSRGASWVGLPATTSWSHAAASGVGRTACATSSGETACAACSLDLCTTCCPRRQLIHNPPPPPPPRLMLAGPSAPAHAAHQPGRRAAAQDPQALLCLAGAPAGRGGCGRYGRRSESFGVVRAGAGLLVSVWSTGDWGASGTRQPLQARCGLLRVVKAQPESGSQAPSTVERPPPPPPKKNKIKMAMHPFCH